MGLTESNIILSSATGSLAYFITIIQVSAEMEYFERKSISTWCVQVLRSPKEAFAAAMQSWRERCEKMCMSTG